MIFFSAKLKMKFADKVFIYHFYCISSSKAFDFQKKKMTSTNIRNRYKLFLINGNYKFVYL